MMGADRDYREEIAWQVAASRVERCSEPDCDAPLYRGWPKQHEHDGDREQDQSGDGRR